MGIKAKDIIYELEKMAPKFLKEDYDNVGLMVGTDQKIVNKVLFALDCTNQTINEAKNINADMIITHHPLIFKKPSRIVSEELQGSKIIELIKNDICLYSSHTNLDSVKGGINDSIVNVLGFENAKIIDKCKVPGFNESGIGRIVSLSKPMELEEIIKLVKEKLNINNLRAVVGKEIITNIAIINGSGQDYFKVATELGAECIITGDTTYHYALDYKELGISIIDAGHFSTEWVAFLEVMKKIEDKFKSDIEFISSKVAQDPYTFY